MTPLAMKKLEFYERKIGAMTSAQALQLAIEAEEHATACGPFDIAYSFMKDQQHTFEMYAQLSVVRLTGVLDGSEGEGMTTYLIAHIGHTQKHHEHVCWWKPESKGYTLCIDKAGLYSEEEARSICTAGLCIAVQVETAAEVARSTPYYRRTDGSLAKLYDGDQHRPVPNDLHAWKHLLAGRLGGCAHPDKPTPIGAKARAIYLTPNVKVTGARAQGPDAKRPAYRASGSPSC